MRNATTNFAIRKGVLSKVLQNCGMARIPEAFRLVCYLLSTVAKCNQQAGNDLEIEIESKLCASTCLYRKTFYGGKNVNNLCEL